MTDPDAKLAALEGILGVDETDELPRPERRRGLGEILGGAGAGYLGDDTPGVPMSPPKVSPLVERVPADAPAARVTPRADFVRATRAVADRRPIANPEAKRRSSAKIPAELVPRLDTAKGRRWGFAEIVSSAVARDDVVDDVTADETLARFEGSVRALYTFTLATADLDALASLGTRWRMNRSQVLTVVLTLEIERLGF